MKIEHSYNKTVTSFFHNDIQFQRFLQTTERLQKLDHIKSRNLYIRTLLVISLGSAVRHHYHCRRPRISFMSAPTHFCLFELFFFPPGDLAKLRKATINFVRPVRPSVLME
jgi:hypothetical protein